MKKILILSTLLFVSVSGYCEDALWRHVAAADSPSYTVFDSLFGALLADEKKPEDVKKGEARATEQNTKPSPPDVKRVPTTPSDSTKTLLPRVRLFSAKLGAMVPTSARMGLPNEGFCVGVMARFPVHPLIPEFGRLEFSCTGTAGSFDIRPSQNGIVYDSIEESYWDISLCYLRNVLYKADAPHFYAGAGLGLAQEVIRYELAGTRSSEKNNSGIFILKVGWDTLSNFFIELSYRRLIDSDSNIEDMLELSFAIYF